MFAASKSGAPVASKDAQFNYVTMLLHGNGTNGSQNNTFLDSSTNNYPITRGGNATQGTFSPYGSNWSNYFDGSGDTLSLASQTALNFGTGDFTLEAWVYATTTLGDATCILTSVSTGGLMFGTNGAAGSGVWAIGLRGISWGYSSSTTPVLNQWQHVAVCRSGTSVRIFINGVQSGTTGTNTTAYNLGLGGTVIGYQVNYMNGYFSNVRATNTALYTTTFTPPTVPLTAVSGTQLLTCQSNRFIDSSSNNFTITNNGDTSVQRFSPFSPTTAYSTSVIGGSAYFDGTSANIITTNTITTIGTQDFCLEAWVYCFSTTDYACIIGNAVVSLFIEMGTTRGIFLSGPEVSLGSAQYNRWFHVAYSRVSGTYAGWVNGVRQATGSFTTNISTAAKIGINNYIDAGLQGRGTTGYISDGRVTVGSSPYSPSSTTITVPTAPLTAITGTVFLASMQNAGILDNGMMNDLQTVGNAQISTSVKKYGTGSLAFDGTGDYLLLQGGQNFTFGTGDFTIEMWIYVVSGLNADIVYYDGRPTSTNGLYNIIYTNSTGKLVYSTNSADRITGTTTLSTGTWYHIALARSGTSTKLFLNGTQEASTYTDSNSYIVGANRPVIGCNGYTLGNAPLNGYIDDLRISKVARYTANFTAPTTAFADKG
jgi:hypothetical protein